jgi:hypothetical protein
MLELLRQVIGEIGKYGLGHVTGRYYGHYMCIVTDNEDPMKTGCVRLYGMIFPGSTNDSSNPYDLWIPPKSNYVGNSSGQFFPPEVGAYVFVTFIDGDYGRPFYDGGFWNEETVVPFKDVQTKKPSVRGIRTTTGYEIMFSEKNDENKENFLRVLTPSGHALKMDDKKDAECVSLADKFGNKYVSDKDGITIADNNGNTFIMAKDGVKLNGQYIVRQEFLEWMDDFKATIGVGNMAAPVPMFPAALAIFVQKFKSMKDKFLSNKEG